MRGAVLGIDLGETKIKFGMVNEDCLLSAYETVPISQIADTGDGSLYKLEALIRAYLEKNHLVPAALSIGFPSTLNRSRRRLQSTPNLPGFNNTDIVSLLERNLHLCPVYIDRDSVMLYYYDRFNYQLPVDSIIIGCYVGTGFGSVISIYGKVLYGHNGSAAELGHIPILGKDHACVCGNTGCIEMLASGHRLQEISQKWYGEPDNQKIFLEHSDDPEITALIDAIAVAVATELNIIDPEFLILGGRVIQMEGFPRALLKKQVLYHARKPYPAANLKIIFSEKRSENGVKGAGLYGFARLKEDGRL